MGLFGGSDNTTSQEVTKRGRQINRNTDNNVDVKSPEEFPVYNNALLLENDYESEEKVGNEYSIESRGSSKLPAQWSQFEDQEEVDWAGIEYSGELNSNSELPTHWIQFVEHEEVSWKSGDEYFAEGVQELPKNMKTVAESDYEMEIELSDGSTVSKTAAEILYGEHRYDDFDGQELPNNNDEDGSGAARDVAEEAAESAVEEIVGGLI